MDKQEYHFGNQNYSSIITQKENNKTKEVVPESHAQVNKSESQSNTTEKPNLLD